MTGRKEPVLPQLDTAPGYKRIARLLETEIVSGRLSPGDLLPTEGELAEQLGVHRSTVREGIRSLENAGLVRRVGAKRLMVSVPDADAVAWVNTRALSLQKVSFHALWEIEMQLEPFAAAAAAQQRPAPLGEALAANLAALRAGLDDDAVVIDCDIDFHQTIAEAAGNPVLTLLAAPLSVLLFSATVDLYRSVPAARHRLLAAHERIAAAVLAGDAATARLWMERHIRDFRRGYELAGFDMNAPIALEPRAFRDLR